MSDLRTLSVPLQTIYAELVDRAWSGDFAELMQAGGTPYTREVNGKLFWYWRTTSAHGVRPAPKYLGPDSEAMRARIAVKKDLASIRKERRDLVRALRSANMPGPDRLTGNILSALAAAGAFRLRAVLVGSVAFQCYLPLLGVRFPATIARTGDLDLAQFHSVSVAVDDEMEADLLTVLRKVDRRFQPITSPVDPGRVMRYAIQVGSQEEFSVDILCPLRGPIRGNFTALKSLRGGAVILKHLDFLIYREVNAVVLHGPGIPVNVPAPERYALHKLIVSQMRIDTPGSQQKARKDLQQADALLRVLASDRPDDLEDAWNELRQRGPSWRVKTDRAVAQLPAETRNILRSMTKGVDSLDEPGKAAHVI